MASHVEKIKERLNIESVVGAYIKLDKAGVNLKAKCPFHNERTPSFFVSPERNNYYCFGCGAKGDIFSFVQEFEKVDFLGALKILAEKAGVSLNFENSEQKSRKENIRKCLEISTKYFEHCLHKTKNGLRAMAYLKKRGLKESTIGDWNVGYALESWDSLYLFLKKKGFDDQDIIDAGLITTSSKSIKSAKTYYDRFRSRIIFPIFDTANRVIGFSGRIFPDKNDLAKYINSPETILFEKGKIFYGLHKAKGAILRENNAVIVEGQIDLILAHQEGFSNTVALSGTAFTLDQINMLKRFSNTITFSPDADDAGMKAAIKSASLALECGLDAKIVSLPLKKDPADVISADPKLWKELLLKSENLIFYSINKAISGASDRKNLIELIRAEALMLIARVSGAMEREYYVKELTRRTGISELSINQDISKLASTRALDQNNSVPPKEIESTHFLARLSESVIGFIFWQKSLKKPSIDISDISDKLSAFMGHKIKEMEKIAESKKNELVLQAEIAFRSSDDLASHIREMTDNLIELSLREDLEALIVKLSVAEQKKDKATVQEILSQCREISKHIISLKTSE